MISMARQQERDGAAKVTAQERDRLQVEHRGERLTVPMAGFPPGFRLRPGGSVILVDEPTGTVARPLVRATVARLPRAEVERRGTVESEGRRLELQEATVLEEIDRPGAPATDEYEIWIVERAEREPTEQVIAARRRRG
jgi:hypothetical protein